MEHICPHCGKIFDEKEEDKGERCPYWHDGLCWGTREQDPTSCLGFKNKCDK